MKTQGLQSLGFGGGVFAKLLGGVFGGSFAVFCGVWGGDCQVRCAKWVGVGGCEGCPMTNDGGEVPDFLRRCARRLGRAVFVSAGDIGGWMFDISSFTDMRKFFSSCSAGGGLGKMGWIVSQRWILSGMILPYPSERTDTEHYMNVRAGNQGRVSGLEVGGVGQSMPKRLRLEGTPGPLGRPAECTLQGAK